MKARRDCAVARFAGLRVLPDSFRGLICLRPLRGLFALLIFGCWASCLAAPPAPGLLFYLSGDQDFTADYAAGGDPQPNFLRGVKMISDGARGRAFECANTQLM